MEIFFVNTDAKSNQGISRHDAWLERGVAITSGDSGYRDQLAAIPKGALILAYANKRAGKAPIDQPEGIVAIGETADSELIEVLPPNTVSPTEELGEYHRKVDWLHDLRSNPISFDEQFALTRFSVIPAVKRVEQAREKILDRLRTLPVVPTSDLRDYARRSAILRRYGSVERPSGFAKPQRTESTATQYYRCSKVRAWTLQRARGCCELCNQAGPFLDDHMEPYLESHHIRHLADEGPDTPENTAALCPNCHRELHRGVDRFTKAERLRVIIEFKEAPYLNAAPPD